MRELNEKQGIYYKLEKIKYRKIKANSFFESDLLE
jgi:hypothetical protein